MRKINFVFAGALALTLGLTSCTDETMEATSPQLKADVMTDRFVQDTEAVTLYEIAAGNGFEMLTKAIIKTELIDALKADGPLTVFAPTDAAFSSLLNTIGQTSIDNVPVPVLTQIVLTHVLQGYVPSTEFKGIELPSLEGSKLSLELSDAFTVNSIGVISADIMGSNGVIHVIDEVLIPETVAPFVNSVLEAAYFNVNFSTLVEAVVKTGMVNPLLSADNVTIFTPTNAAFAAAGIDVANTDRDVLFNVLSYHVAEGRIMSADLARTANTIGENVLHFSIIPAGVYIDGNAQVIAADITGSNGVVHVINQVLTPPTGNLVDTALKLSETGEFTHLVTALVRTATEGTPEQNLITVLSSEGPFSVFAPTNAAFEALINSNSAWNSLNDIPRATLIEVLKYHVVPAKAFDKDLAGALNQNNQLGTAQGSALTFDLNELMINGTSKIIGVNTKATNGVIHVIDNVLIPYAYDL